MKNIYVGNLGYQTSEEELRSAFESFGAVDKVTLVRDRDTGQSRGFAFVEMVNDEEAERAIAGVNGKVLDGRTLNVNEARPKREGGGGGRGFGGGGGRGGSRDRRSGGGGGRGGYGRY